MILQSLVRYYDKVSEQDENMPCYGWAIAKVTDALVINENGIPTGLISLRQEKMVGKKTNIVPRNERVPIQGKRSVNIKANFSCDTPSYMLGIGDGDKAERARQCFEASKQLHMSVLENCDCKEAVAVKRFFTSWHPDKAKENKVIAEHWPEFKDMGNLVLEVDGRFLHEVKEVSEAWEHYFVSDDNNDVPRRQCLVTGHEDEPIEILHPSIKGVLGAQSSGASLISFNAEAFESYGLEKAQGLNAPVGKVAAFKYTTALNHLLANEGHRKILGDTTVAFWSESESSSYEESFISFLWGDETSLKDKDLKAVLDKLSQGLDMQLDNFTMKADEPFYILGLAPNAARLSVRFFLTNTFGGIIRNIRDHQRCMSISAPPGKEGGNIPIWLLTKRMGKPKDKNVDKNMALLAGALFRAIIAGGAYPVAAYRQMLARVFAERDEYDENGRLTSRKIDYVRAGFIKACLLNNFRNSWEGKIEMGLNENCKEPAYLLGRIFAVLERIQQNANPEIKATIKERYFNSACTNPSVTYPTLLKLANAHLAKLSRDKKGQAVKRSKELGALMEAISMPDTGLPLPKRLSLDEQGAFIVGYYQQAQAYFKKQEDEDNE